MTLVAARFFEEIEQRVNIVKNYVMRSEYTNRFHPSDMREAVTCYFESGGKRLRPVVLLLCVGAVGGDEEKAISAAAAVEIFHTWTLVHDDLIDRDPTRRGGPTVHERFYQKPTTKTLYQNDDDGAKHYGVSIAVLAGDVQHGWGISLMTELTTRYGLDPAVTLKLIDTLDTRVLCTLVDGEMLDVQYSKIPIAELTQDQIQTMLWKKTGALYEFCGTSGAAIGLNTTDFDHPYAANLAAFCSACGSAFQLQDDILGIIGDEDLLGKPVGSDIREGKRTAIVKRAYETGAEKQKIFLMETLGNINASQAQIEEMIKLLRDSGAIAWTAEIARNHVKEALNYLDIIPNSLYKDLLAEWAELMISREF